MIIVNSTGGLGNQMFQYAFTYAFAKKNNTLLKLDISDFESYDLRQYELDHFCIVVDTAKIADVKRLKYKKESLLTRIFRRLTKQKKIFSKNYYRELCFQFDSAVFNQQGDIYFDGYWQSEKYFLDYREDLLKLFTLKEDIHAKSKHYQKNISANQAVSLHIRRGDYVTDPKTNNFHGTCDIDYYRLAVSFINNHVDHPHYFIFSDDFTWAKENLDFIKQITFIELEPDAPDHEEIWLMSQCQHNIIANSSFSWWGAWLNQHPDKIVIAPQRWFRDTTINTKDLIPCSWIRL